MFRCKKCGEPIDERQYNVYNNFCSQCYNVFISKKQDLITKKQITEKPRKNGLLIAGLIGFFLIIPILVFYYVPFSYVGIQEGDEFTWNYSFDNKTFEKYNNATAFDASSLFPSRRDATIEVVVKDIKEEDEYDLHDVYRDRDLKDVEGTELETKYSFSSEPDIDLDFIVFKYDKDVYSTLLIFGDLFIAREVNFAEAAQEIQDYYDDEDIEVEVVTQGHSIDLNFEADGNLSEIVLSSSYSYLGVLLQFSFYYDDEILMSFRLEEGNKVGEIATNVCFILFIIFLISIISYVKGVQEEILFYDKIKPYIFESDEMSDLIYSRLKIGIYLFYAGIMEFTAVLAFNALLLYIASGSSGAYQASEMNVFLDIFWIPFIGLLVLCFGLGLYYHYRKKSIELISKKLDEETKV